MKIKNKRDVSDQILDKFGTLEQFAEKTGINYQLVVDGLVSTGHADKEFIETLQENGIRVEI